MRKLLLAMLAVYLVGCASAPEQSYRPSGYNGPAWRIDGNWKESLLGDDTIKIRINGQTVITGKFPILNNTVELSGTYEEYQITASCVRTHGYLGTTIQAMVFVDNERAATLQF